MMIMNAKQMWQRALVYSVRTDIGVKELGISPETEFDEYDTFHTDYILAVDGNTPAGTCRIRFDEKLGYGKIERVNVISSYRNKGLGKAMIEYAEQFILNKGYAKVLITSREEAVGFYEKLGYDPYYSEAFQSTVYKVIPMKKDLR